VTPDKRPSRRDASQVAARYPALYLYTAAHGAFFQSATIPPGSPIEPNADLMTDALTKLHEIEARLQAARAAEKAALAKLANLNSGGRLELVEFNLRLRAAKNARQTIADVETELQAHLQRFYRKA